MKSCTISRCIASMPEPEGGARCVSSARRDLDGGQGAILVPTTTIFLATRRKDLGVAFYFGGVDDTIITVFWNPNKGYGTKPIAVMAAK